MQHDPGRKWPWIVLGSIMGVVGLSYWTVKIALNNPVQMSDIDMQDYRHFEHDANENIRAKVAFDQKYAVEYKTETFKPEGAEIMFKVTTRSGTPVNDANFTVRVTRPGTHEFDRNVTVRSVQDGLYSFETFTLPKEGRWDVLTRIQIGNDYRYLNLKADTRSPNVFEY